MQAFQLEVPSTIQTLAIPTILDGSHVLMVAPTGTGKTLAALLPVFDMFLRQRSLGKTKGISILYVTPLRALNRDLLRHLQELGRELDIRIEVRHGDTPVSARVRQAHSPPDMLITTPESLQAILVGRRIKLALQRVTWVIIDEIHELIASKRGVQLAVALERLRSMTPIEFQRIGLSATIGDPELVAEFLAGRGRRATVIQSPEAKRIDVTVESPTPSEDDEKDAKLLGIPSVTVARLKRIMRVINQYRSTLIFTNTREHAEALGAQIRALDANISLAVHHGSLSKEIRETVEKSFQEGALRAIVCTSSLELGIDIGSVENVVHFMSARGVSRLIQRVGRSGHAIGAVPKGLLICTHADDILEGSILVNFADQGRLEAVKVHENSLDVLSHQIVGILLQERNMECTKLFEFLTQAYPYRSLNIQQFLEVLDFLELRRMIRISGQNVRPRIPLSINYYYTNLSVIPDVRKYTVFDFIRKRRIGSLDEEFVARRCRTGSEFILHGETWKVISVDEEKSIVEAEPSAPSLSAIPGWEGEIIPVDYHVASRVGSLRLEIADGSLIPEVLTERFGLTTAALEKADGTLRSHSKSYPVPTPEMILVESFENAVVVHACFGNLVNETLALILAAIFSSKTGTNVATQVDQYRFALIFPYKVSSAAVAQELSRLSPVELEKILFDTIKNSEMFSWRNWHNARRFGIVSRDADYSSSKARLLTKALSDTPVVKETVREVLLDKLDLERAKGVLQAISERKIKVSSVDKKDSCSPLAIPLLDRIVSHDVLRPAIATKPVSEIIRSRLQAQTMKLVCYHKFDWAGIRQVRVVAERPQCPKCKSTLIAATYASDDETTRVGRRKLRGEKLTRAEEEVWSKGWKSSGLVQTYGKKAVVCLAARGVGPTVATRILGKHLSTEEEFYAEILRAEREFQRTRLFWT